MTAPQTLPRDPMPGRAGEARDDEPATGSVVRPDDHYRARRDRFAQERDALTRRWNRVANLRLLAFLAAASGLGYGVWQRSALAAVAGVILLGVFLLLVRHHGDLGRRRRRAAILHDLNAEALSRIARDWDALPLRYTIRAAPGHPFAADLDLFGRASLLHLLDTTSTPMGGATLARWLLEPAAPAEVRERQEAVAELAPVLDLRQELALRGRLRERGTPDPEPFLSWAEGGRWLAHRRSFLWTARAGTLLLWSLIAAWAVGLLSNAGWITLALVVNVLIAQVVAGRAHHIVARAASQQGAVAGYAAALDLLAGARLAAPLLQRFQADLAVEGRTAPEWLRRLNRLTGLVIPRDSLAYPVIQALTLWDVHLLAALERWQDEAGARVRRWLDVLGDVEALTALAGLAHDQPGWTYPEVETGLQAMAARGLGHPLLADGVRVVNDVQVGPPGTFLLVTGSNMSGKSTLLRALGVNAVLAGAGAPVCAVACQLPPVTLWTSVRVEDSLEHGVSFFMAELQRLKAVTDAARANRMAGDRAFLYLLDEILQGTNTAERRIAARCIIGHLIAQGAIGAVSTHDLDLADEEPLASAARPIHFSEQVGVNPGDPAMSFDYKARPGIATSTNALRLMALIGLDLAPAEASVVADHGHPGIEPVLRRDRADRASLGDSRPRGDEVEHPRER